MNKKHILCYGDSNTYGYDAQGGGRFDDQTRWTRQLQSLLGDDYLVIEEGLSGRTTVFPDPVEEGRCGLDCLAPILMSHGPLDLLVLMLGTNDCKQRFAATATNIKDGLLRLVNKAKQLEVWAEKTNILVVAPIQIAPGMYSDESLFRDGMGAGCVEKSQQLPVLLEAMAAQNGCAYLDCNPYTTPVEKDFTHFDRDSHTRFARAMAQKIKELSI